MRLLIFILYMPFLIAIEITSTPIIDINTDTVKAKKRNIKINKVITVELSQTLGKSYEVLIKNTDDSNDSFSLTPQNLDQKIDVTFKYGMDTFTQPGKLLEITNDNENSRNIQLELEIKTKNIEIFESLHYLKVIKFVVNEFKMEL